MSKKLKILFIPADNITANISRSYFFAKGLAQHSELYFITWHDHRTAKWLGGSSSKLNTLICFFKSLFASYKLYRNKDENFYRVNCSVFIDALVGRLLGRVNGKKIMRKHNAKTLQKLVSNINPDVIFYSDAAYFFSTMDNTNILQVCDLQDDLEWNIFPESLQKWEKNYYKKQFEKFDIHYIVSNSASSSISKQIGSFPFKTIYNGADFRGLQNDYSKEINAIKSKHNLHDKYIITHVGSATWVDPIFTKKLFNEIYKRDKSIVLLLIGSMNKVDLPNVINIGMVPANESYIYYNITDLALLLKDSIGSGFLYNSVPLKNIQYGAARKPVISFPIEWLEKEAFSNTTIINNSDIEKWIKVIKDVRTTFKWTQKDTSEWESYNWNSICDEMYDDIVSKLK